MEMLLIGLAIYILTFIVGKLNRRFPNLSLRLFVAILCLIAGTVYYFIQTSYPELLEQTIKFVGGSFAVSQAIWMVVDKFLPTKPTNPIV